MRFGADILVFSLFGLVFGSFASALSYRLPRGENISSERSRCTACDTKLSARDLIPLISWAFAGGRCRYCGAGISWRYPALEAATALIFALAGARAAGDLVAGARLSLIGFSLMVIAVSALETGKIPGVMLAVLAVLAGWSVYTDMSDWRSPLAGLLLLGGTAAIGATSAALLRRRKFDAGLVILSALAGLLAGVDGLPRLVVALAAFALALAGLARIFRGDWLVTMPSALCAALILCIFYQAPSGVAEGADQ